MAQLTSILHTANNTNESGAAGRHCPEGAIRNVVRGTSYMILPSCLVEAASVRVGNFGNLLAKFYTVDQMKIFSLLALSVFLLVMQGCASPASSSMSEDQCKSAKYCAATGMVKMGADGHGYIGELYFPSGGCINFSLPTEMSKELADVDGRLMTLSGSVMKFPRGEDILFFKVNGRRVGYGVCGSVFIFVDDKDVRIHGDKK